MGTALNKFIALEKGIKAQTNKEVSAIYKQIQKPALFAGIARTYQPLNDDDAKLPAESTKVQMRTSDILDRVATAMTRLFDVVATKDKGNTLACADIIIPSDGTVIASNVPVPYLLFLEKQLTDLKTFVETLPLLDPAEDWKWSETNEVFATTPVETHRTKKIPRVLVQAEATKEHPAQTTVYNEDVIAGYWTQTKFSGAIPDARRRELHRRVIVLHEAVKVAREEANATKVDDVKIGAQIFDWLFAT